MSAEEFRRQLDAISAEYRRELPARLEQIDRLWRALVDGDSKPDRLAELLRELHSLAGSAKTFGVAGVGEAAAAAEGFIEPFARKNKLPDATRQAAFAALLEALRRAAA